MDRFNVTKGAVQRSSNFLLSQRGALTVCDGTGLVAQQAINEAIREIGIYVDPTSFAIFPIAGAPNAAGTALDVWGFSLAGGGFTLYGSPALTPGWIMPQFENYAGLTILALGNGVPLVKFAGPLAGGGFTTIHSGVPGVPDIPRWQANHFYTIGQRIAEPSTNPGGTGTKLSTWQVVNVNIGSSTGSMSNSSGIGSGGMSSATMPVFGASDSAVQGTGQTVADNQIIWMCIKQDEGHLARQFPPTGAQHIIKHANALWAWNTAPHTTIAGGSIDGPSVLRMSDPNSADAWPVGNTEQVGADDGTMGTGMATFTVAEAGITPTGNLVLFKDYSTYLVSGVFQATDFAIKQVKSDMGCLAPRSIQFATGFGVVRFCHLGFALMDGINDRLISEEVRPYIYGDAVTAGVDFARLAEARATLTTNPPLYLCSLPTTDGLTTRIFVYDLVMRAWMMIDYMNSSPTYPITSMTQLRPPAVSGFNAITLLADTGPGGMASIRHFQNGATAWDATSPPTPIGWSFRPPEVGEPGSRAYFRRANVRLTAPQPGQITGYFNIGEESQPPNQQLPGGAGPSSGTAPNVATIANYFGNEDLGVALDVHQTGPSLNGTYTGSGPANIEGIDYHITAKEPRPFGQRF